MFQERIQGVNERFFDFLNAVSNLLSGGPAFALGDAPLIPRSKVFPPFGRSGQRIPANVSHLIARPSYTEPVFFATVVLVGYLTG